jgi:predicted kinase
MLVVMAGLPAAGKSAVAAMVGRALPAAVVSVDPIEAAMWRAGVAREQPTGVAAYEIARTVADGVLALGQSVIVDAVNAVEIARDMWRELAARRAVPLTFVEVVCSDGATHRHRFEHRTRGIDGFPEPTWAQVVARRAEFAPWPAADRRLVLDSMDDLRTNVAKAVAFVTDGP